MAKSKWPEVEEKLNQGLVEAWGRNGLTEEQIAHNLGISLTTLKTYKNAHPPFLAALKRGKEVVDIEVENSLHKRANGYEYDELTYERDPVSGQMLVTKITRKQVAPDPTSMIFWLKNRRPDLWRDKREHGISGPDGGPVQFGVIALPEVDGAE